MPRSHIHGSPRRFYYGLNLTDDPGNANFRSQIRMHYISTTYDYGCNTESYGPIQIATNDAGLYPWLIRRPVRECVTWALASLSRRPGYRQITEIQRLDVYEAGARAADLPCSFGCNERLIYRLQTCFRQSGSKNNKPPPGRPRTTTPLEIRVIVTST